MVAKLTTISKFPTSSDEVTTEIMIEFIKVVR